MSSTELLAIIGAIGSAVAITWNFIKTIQDRAKLKIEAMIGKMFPDFTGKDFLVITVINVGRRPIVVKKWGMKKKKSIKGERFILLGAHKLPRLLKEGEYHAEPTAPLSMLSSDIEKIIVWDSLGREWKVSRKNLKRLFEDLKKLKSADKE